MVQVRHTHRTVRGWRELIAACAPLPFEPHWFTRATVRCGRTTTAHTKAVLDGDPIYEDHPV